MDFKKSDVSTTIDSSLTMVMGDDMVKVGVAESSYLLSYASCMLGKAGLHPLWVLAQACLFDACVVFMLLCGTVLCIVMPCLCFA